MISTKKLIKPAVARISLGSLELIRFQYLCLLGITLLAGALRFYSLGKWSFWIDEVLTIERSQHLFENITSYSDFMDALAGHPSSLVPTYIVLKIFGTNEWTARLVPALVGVLSVPILYFPVRKLLGPVVGLSSVLLLAVSPWHLYWSQNARFYIPLLLFYTLAIFAFYFGIEEDRPSYLVVSLLFLALAVKERLIALFFLPVVGSYLLLLVLLPMQKPKGLRVRNLLLMFLPALIVGLYFARGYVQEPVLWVEDFGHGRVGQSPLSILSQFTSWVGVSTIVMAAVGTVYLSTTRGRISLLLGLGATIPLFGTVAAALFQFSTDRYVFIALMSWLILASLAATELLSQAPKNVKVLTLGVFLILLLDPLRSDMQYFRYTNGSRLDWRGAVDYVIPQKEPSDLIVTNKPEMVGYYLGDEVTGMNMAGFRIVSEMVEKNGTRVWVIENEGLERVDPEFQRWVEEDFELVHITFGVRVYLYDP